MSPYTTASKLFSYNLSLFLLRHPSFTVLGSINLLQQVISPPKKLLISFLFSRILSAPSPLGIGPDFMYILL